MIFSKNLKNLQFSFILYTKFVCFCLFFYTENLLKSLWRDHVETARFEFLKYVTILNNLYSMELIFCCNPLNFGYYNNLDKRPVFELLSETYA